MVKKKIVLLALVAGLGLGCMPQAKANGWDAVAGAVTGTFIGMIAPILVYKPIQCSATAMIVSAQMFIAAKGLSLATMSDMRDDQNDYGMYINKFLPLGLIVSVAALANGAALSEIEKALLV